MSRFEALLSKISEALPVAPTQTQQPVAGQAQQPVKPGTPVQPQTAQQQIQNPAIQALAAAKTADDVAKILADPANQQALQNFLQKK